MVPSRTASTRCRTHLLGRDGVGPGPRRRRRRAGHDRARRRPRAGRGRPPRPGHPGHPADRRRAFPARHRPARWTGHRARNDAEAEFLAIGDGAGLWLTEAAAAGTAKIRVKMAAGGRRWRSCSTTTRSTGRWGTPRSTAGSARRPRLDPGPPRPPPSGRQPGSRAGEDRSPDPGHRQLGRPRPPPAPPAAADERAACTSTRTTCSQRREWPATIARGDCHAGTGRAAVRGARPRRRCRTTWRQLLRRLRLPYIRRLAPELLATAKAQRWEPVEVLRALFAEEVAGRDRSALPPAAPPPGSPPAKPSTPGTRRRPRSRPRPSKRCAPWNGCTAGRTSWSAGRPGPGRRSSSKPSASTPSRQACKVAWFTLEDLGVLLRRHRADDTVTKAIARILRADLVVVDDIGLLPVAHDAAEGLYRLVDAAYEKRSIAISLEPAPGRVRRADAQNPGHRHRRPAPAPRPRLPNHRRLRPPHPSPRRARSEPLDLTHHRSVGGQHRADPMATTGQFS